MPFSRGGSEANGTIAGDLAAQSRSGESYCISPVHYSLTASPGGLTSSVVVEAKMMAACLVWDFDCCQCRHSAH